MLSHSSNSLNLSSKDCFFSHAAAAAEAVMAAAPERAVVEAAFNEAEAAEEREERPLATTAEDGLAGVREKAAEKPNSL